MADVVATWVFDSSQTADKVCEKIRSDVYPGHGVDLRDNKVIINSYSNDVAKASRICEAFGGKLE